MRAFFFVLALLGFSVSYGQDYCKKIKKEISPDKKSFDYSSPFDPQEVPAVKVTRNINTDPDYPSDNFFIIFQTVGNLESIYTKNDAGEQVEKDEKHLVIDFSDGTRIMADTIVVSHDFTSDKLQAIRYVYFPLTELTVKDFTAKKITKFSLAGYEQTIVPDSAIAIQQYVQCIRDAK